MYKFLIIVPTLNSFKSLPKLIHSLEEQKYKNWDVLFVDGKSNKNHKQFLLELVNRNAKFSFINQKDFKNGIYGAMNEGLKYSKKADFVLFWGSDDYCSDKETFNRIVNAIKKTKGINPDIFLCKAAYISEKNKNILRSSYFLKKSKFLSFQEINNLIFYGSSPPHQGTIYSSKFFDSNYSYDIEYKLAGDLDLFIKIALNNSTFIKNIDAVIVHLGNNGISNRSTSLRLREVKRIYSKYFGFLWFVPFTLRYIRRIRSRLLTN